MLRTLSSLGVGSFALLSILAAAPMAAADDCTGWFCGGEEGAPTPVPTLPVPGQVGTATIPGPAGNDVLSGVITEIVPGDHLTLKLPNGELKVITWPMLLQLQIQGKIVIGGGGATTAPPPPAAPPPTVVITPAPPPAAPPPPPAPVYDMPPQAMQPPTRHFRERWQLGVRLNFLSPSEGSSFGKGGVRLQNGGDSTMRDFMGSGTAIQADLGYRVSPSWTPYGFFEYGSYKRGGMNADTDDKPTSTAIGFGLNANTNPDGVGFLFDIGIGYRWITVPYSAGGQYALDGIGGGGNAPGKVTYGGAEMLRLGLGLSFATSDHVRWDLTFQGAVGSVSHRSDSNGACVSPEDCKTIPDDKRGAYAFGGLSAALHLDL
jgi:hypothetical protein